MRTNCTGSDMGRTMGFQRIQPLEKKTPPVSRWRTFLRNRGAVAFAAVGCLFGALLLRTAAADEAVSPADLKRLTLEELMSVEVGTVTTASKKEEKVQAAPAQVIVITANDIRLRGYSSLKDVLRDLPGMETIEYYFSEIGTQVPVRGIAGNNKIIVLVNGMRVNPPGGENFPLRNDFSVRAAERIEVMYGPGSTLYGQDAISAVINVITKKPGDKPGGEVGAGGGLNRERETWGSFGGPLDKDGNLKLSGYAQYYQSDLTKLNKEYPDWWKAYRDLAEPRNAGVVPHREDFGLNIYGRLDIYNESYVQVWARESRRSSSESGYPPAYVPEAIWEDQSSTVEAKNTHDFSDSLKLGSSLIYSRYEIDPSSRYVFNTPTLIDSWFLNDFKYGIGENITWEETIRGKIGEKLSLVGGAMASTYNIVPKSTIPGGAHTDEDLVSQGGSFTYSTPGNPRELVSIPRVVRSRYQTYAGYLEGGWQIHDDLKMIAGTRVTKDTRFDDMPVTPRAALVYDMTDQLTAKYIFTRAYVAPAPYFANAVYDNGTLLATSSPELKPEKAEMHEVNLSYNKKNLSLGASTYCGTLSEIITLSDQALPQNIVERTVYLNGSPAQPRTLVQTANGGDSTSIGGELYGRATLGAVSPWFSYSYADFNQDVNGITSSLPGISAHNGRLGLTWAVTSKLFITPSLVIRSTPENVEPGVLKDELHTPWQVNLYTIYNLSKRIDVFVDLRNVTDRHYALGGISGQAVPQETFNGMLGVRATF